jgi:hypothetical protein
MASMKKNEKFYIEGHRAKTSLEDENTLLIDRPEAYPSLQEATQKAKQYFDTEKELSLAVIYKEDPLGECEGVKFFYRDEEGNLEQADLFW